MSIAEDQAGMHDLPNFALNRDTTMVNTAAMVTVLFGAKMPYAEKSPFRLRMARLWELAGVPYETFQKGTARPGQRGRTDCVVTIEHAQHTFDFAQEYGLYVPSELNAVTRTRNPRPLVKVPVDRQKQLLEEENARLRARLAEAGVAV